MEFIQSIQGVIGVSILVILDLFAVVKAVMVIIAKVKALQGTSEEERQAAKESVIENLQQIIFGLVTDAEKELGAGTGKLKSAKVAAWVYDKIPDELKPLFSAEDIQEMIDTVLREAQEYWSKNSNAAAYISSGTSPLLTAELAALPGMDADTLASAIAEAFKVAAETPQDAQTAADDKEPTPNKNEPTEAAERPAEAENKPAGSVAENNA